MSLQYCTIMMRRQKMSRLVFVLWALSQCLTILEKTAAGGSNSWNFGSIPKFGAKNRRNFTASGNKWSAMLSVDPSNILSLMIHYGGLLLPDAVEKDIQILEKVCDADDVELNVLEKILIIYNFTIHLPNEADALRVGKVVVRWDSYLQPCLEIVVENVFIMVEFLNAMMTKNNWSELKRFGFPPEFDDDSEDDDSAFLRIGSIDLSGNITACLKHRLREGKDLARVQWGLDALEDLDRDIRNQSIENLAKLGRRGCSSTELFDLIQTFFSRKTKEMLVSTLQDLVEGSGDTIEEVNRVVDTAKKKVLEFAAEALDDITEQSHATLFDSIDLWQKKFDRLNDEARPLKDSFRLLNATRSDTVKNAIRRMKGVINSNSFIQRQPGNHGATDQG